MKNKKIIQWVIISLIALILGLTVFGVVKSYLSGESKLPEAAQRNPRVKEAYLFALEHPDLLEKIPCFCGCANTGHKSNKDCYYDHEGNLADHGSLCGGCVGITLDVKQQYQQGKSVSEIRSFIDEKYGSKEYAIPTPTPPVE
jgi:hypothetical protein